MDEREPGVDSTDGLLLDIGEGIGALVIYADARLLGRQIDLGTPGGGAHGIHNVVRDRAVGERIVYAAVFPDIAAGEYDIVPLTPTQSVKRVRIVGGRVTEVNVASP